MTSEKILLRTIALLNNVISSVARSKMADATATTMIEEQERGSYER
jgi:hypothetical protein